MIVEGEIVCRRLRNSVYYGSSPKGPSLCKGGNEFWSSDCKSRCIKEWLNDTSELFVETERLEVISVDSLVLH